MPGDPTSQGRAFPPTQWDLIERAAAGDRQALGALYQLYRPPLRLYLLHKLRVADHDADEFLQAFIVEKVLIKNCIAAARRERGKFRNFLLTSLINYVVSDLRKRRPADVSLDDPDVQEIAAGRDGPIIDEAWGRTLIAETLRRVQTDYEESGRLRFWQLFEARIVRPILHDEVPLEYTVAIERFGFRSPQEAFNAVADAKRKFKAKLEDVIGEYGETRQELRTEIREMRELLARFRRNHDHE
jgi:DNA-directed RNA polymerase specialized sigma24 family protein